MNGSPYAIAGVLAFAILIAVPEQSRTLTTEVFALLAMLFQSVRDTTRSYIKGFPSYSRRLMAGAGVRKFYFQRSIGSNITFAVALVALLADFHVVVMTFEGILGKQCQSLPFLTRADVPLSISLALIFGSMTIGIAFFDLLGYTHWIPLPLLKRHQKSAMAIIIILLLGAFVAFYALVETRHHMASLVAGTDAEVIKAEMAATLKSPLVLYLYCYLSILCCISSILGFACFTAAVASWVIAFLAVLIVPAGIICGAGILCDRIVTHSYNILLRILSLIQGLFYPITKYLRDKEYVRDNPQAPDLPPDNAAIQQPVEAKQDAQEQPGNAHGETQDADEGRDCQKQDTPGFDYSAFNILKKDGDK